MDIILIAFKAYFTRKSYGEIPQMILENPGKVYSCWFKMVDIIDLTPTSRITEHEVYWNLGRFVWHLSIFLFFFIDLIWFS